MRTEKAATTLRLPEEKLRVIRAIAGYENRSLTDIYEEMTVEYIERQTTRAGERKNQGAPLTGTAT